MILTSPSTLKSRKLNSRGPSTANIAMSTGITSKPDDEGSIGHRNDEFTNSDKNHSLHTAAAFAVLSVRPCPQLFQGFR